MKKLTLVVTLEFEDSIYSDTDKKEIAENVACAIEREAKEMGISPEDSDTFVKSINVSNGNIFNVTKKLV